MAINNLVFNLTSSFVQSRRIKCVPRSGSKRRKTRVPIAGHTKRPKSCGENQRVEAPSDVKLSSSSTLPFADGLEPYALPRRKSSRCNPPQGHASMSANLSRSLLDRRPSKLSQGDFPNNGQSESASRSGVHFREWQVIQKHKAECKLALRNGSKMDRFSLPVCAFSA
jgi:hypothetical protein